MSKPGCSVLFCSRSGAAAARCNSRRPQPLHAPVTRTRVSLPDRSVTCCRRPGGVRSAHRPETRETSPRPGMRRAARARRTTKVSLKDAKMCATPKTCSPSLRSHRHDEMSVPASQCKHATKRCELRPHRAPGPSVTFTTASSGFLAALGACDTALVNVKHVHAAPKRSSPQQLATKQ